MSALNVELLIPFESLVDSIKRLNWNEKRQLWKLLEEQMDQAEEETWERDPAFRAEIQDARAAYQAGDHVTIDEYISHQQEN